MVIKMKNSVTEDEVIAACNAGSFYVTPEIMKDVRKMLEGFVANRKEPERVPIAYQFRHRATKFYVWSNWEYCAKEVVDIIIRDKHKDTIQVRSLYTY